MELWLRNLKKSQSSLMSNDPIDPSQDSDEVLKAKLNMETSRIRWEELQRFYARGNVVGVAADLDLLEVGVAMARDDKERLQQWMAEGKAGEVSPDQARHWYENNTELWALVVAPWILVQDEAIKTLQ